MQRAETVQKHNGRHILEQKSVIIAAVFRGSDRGDGIAPE